MKTPWVRRPKLKEKGKFLSSNEKYVVTIYEQQNELSVWAKNKSSLYDLVDTIYNDCIMSLNLSTPLTCHITFYGQRNMVYVYKLENCQSVEDTLKELSKQFVV